LYEKGHRKNCGLFLSLSFMDQTLRIILTISSRTAAPAKAVMISLTMPEPMEICNSPNSQQTGDPADDDPDNDRF